LELKIFLLQCPHVTVYEFGNSFDKAITMHPDIL
jgi:hypothetical protein